MIYVDILVVELTRRCNLNCSHCLRGDQQNKVISDDVLVKISNLFEAITIDFGGGESSLSPKKLKRALELISHQEVHITTNGRNRNWKSFLHTLSRDINANTCSLRISNDKYHQQELGHSNTSFKYEVEEYVNYELGKDNFDVYLNGDIEVPLSEGRAYECGIYPCRNEILYFSEEDEYLDVLYVDCKGNIFLSCNLSYETMDLMSKYKSHLWVGNVFEENIEVRLLERYKQFQESKTYTHIKEEFDEDVHNRA